MSYSIVDWYESLRLVLDMLSADVQRIQDAFDTGNIAAVRAGFMLLKRNMQHTCVTWQSPSLALDGVMRDVLAWRHQTFPLSTPASTFAHLQREMGELAADPSSAEELADVLMLVIGLADVQRIDLTEAVRCKLAIVKTRDWGQPDADGVVEHVRVKGQTTNGR